MSDTLRHDESDESRLDRLLVQLMAKIFANKATESDLHHFHQLQQLRTDLLSPRAVVAGRKAMGVTFDAAPKIPNPVFW